MAKSLLDDVEKLAGEAEFVHAWKCNRDDCSHYAMICSCRDDVKFLSSLFFLLNVSLDQELVIRYSRGDHRNNVRGWGEKIYV